PYFAVAGCRTFPPLEPARLAALEAELGQLLLVGFDGTEAEDNPALERLLCETRVGGVVLFARNIVSDVQTARLTRALATRSRECTGRPLLIAVDAEGGQVMRLGPELRREPPARRRPRARLRPWYARRARAHRAQALPGARLELRRLPQGVRRCDGHGEPRGGADPLPHAARRAAGRRGHDRTRLQPPAPPALPPHPPTPD